MNINCEIARDLLPLYKDRCLSASSEEALRSHLSECSECRRYLNEYRETFKAERGSDAASPSGNYSALAKRLRQHRTATEFAVGLSFALLLAYGLFKTIGKKSL